ncbi:site-specific integrase [Azospirillum halopraeferens]|uniref:site-specific integrase n=1 Tax=Azospirillum halopraeferens TaxID=34010 RepID=UPI000415E6F9|nr:site-specific integrase [Azospirillum halopraeferens]
MSASPHLYRRGTAYWWRRRVPKRVQAAFSRRVFAFSLRTHIPCEARSRAARLRAATDALFDGVWQAMALGLALTREQMDAVIVDLIRHEIDAAEYARALSQARTPEEADAAAARARAMRAELQTALRLNQLEGVRGPLDAALGRFQLTLPPETPDYRVLLRQAAWGLTRVATVNEQREKGLYEEDAFFTMPPNGGGPSRIDPPMGGMAGVAAPPPATVPTPPSGDSPAPSAGAIGTSGGARTTVGPAPQGGGITVKQAFERLIAEKSSSSSWVKNMRRKVEASCRLVLETMGDIPLSAVSKDQVEEFRTLVAQLPADHGKRPRDTRTIRELVDDINAEEQDRLDELRERVDLGLLSRTDFVDLRERTGVRRLTSTTINLHMDRLSSVFQWAIDNDLFFGRNPCSGKRLDAGECDARDREVPRTERMAWGREGLRALFTSPAFRGEGLRTDALFWAPLIAAHAGLRSEEVLQLQLEDIRQRDGVWCLRIWDGPGRTVKNKASVREVPLHATLIALGILDLVAIRRREGCKRLFADLERGAVTETFTELFSKRFGRYTREHGLWAPEHDFHSLRKDFNVRLREGKVPVGARKRLIGHVIKDMTDGTYDPLGESMITLREYVDRIDHGIRVGPNRELLLDAGASSPVAQAQTGVETFAIKVRA